MRIYEDPYPARWLDDGIHRPLDLTELEAQEREGQREARRRFAWFGALLQVAGIVFGVIAFGFTCVYVLGIDR